MGRGNVRQTGLPEPGSGDIFEDVGSEKEPEQNSK